MGPSGYGYEFPGEKNSPSTDKTINWNTHSTEKTIN